MNLLCNSFEGSNEKKWVATEGKGSRVKYRETSFEGEGFVKIPWDSPCMTVVKMEWKTKQKRGRHGVGNKIKIKKAGNVTGGLP